MPGRLSLGLAVTLVLAAAPAHTGMESLIVTADVKTYSCRELLALEEPRRNLALTYFSGYVDGQRSLDRLDIQAKSMVIEKVLEHCRGDAAGSVLEAFRRFTP
jgi:HdeA/HdeB family